MHPFLTSRLRTRLVLLALVAVVPALAVIAYTQSSERGRLRQQTHDDALRLIRLAANQQAAVFDGVERLLLTVVQFPALRGSDPGPCTDLLVKILRDHPDYVNIGVVNGDGSGFCSAVPFIPRAKVQELAGFRPVVETKWFRRAIETKSTAIGDYQISATSGQPALIVAQPIIDTSGAVERVAYVTIGIRSVNRIVSQLQFPPGTMLALFDRNRTIVARYPEPDRWLGQSLPPMIQTPASRDRARESLVEATDDDGVRRLFATVPVQAQSGLETGLYASLVMDATGPPGGANRLLGRQLWLLAFVTFATIAVALIGGELFVLRPVETLRGVTERLARGDFNARAQLDAGVPGLSELGQAVNTMAVALEARQRERDEAEAGLRASAEHYRQFFEDNPHPMWVYDPETLAFLAVNEAAVSQYGYTRDAFLTRTVRDLHPEADWPALDDRMRADASGYSGSWRHRTKDGQNVHVEVRSNVVPWRGRSACLALVDNITDRKALEDQLRQSQKMEAIGQLAGGIAHDFNNLLTVIHGYTEILTGSLDESDARRSDVEEISRAAHRAAALTRQLLAFSRKQILAPRVFLLGDVVRELTPMLRRLIGETIDLKTITNDRDYVKADSGQFEQVLMNLVINARDAMPSGGRLTIETSSVALDDDYPRRHPSARPGPHVMLAVSDTGRGMDVETRARIFEPFFTTKPKGQGTGLGLSMVYGVVKQSDGHIWVYSESGRGSTFKIYLPRTEEPSELQERRPGQLARLDGSETILVVEDEEVVREFVERVMRRHGYTVHAIADPKEAIEFATTRTLSVDLLVTDVVLPEMSGPALAELVQREHPGSKVLYMSGYTDNAVVRHGVLDAEMSFLQKPFTTEALLHTIRDVLDSSA
jgi:two-component system cell cycle sensor histidine kinase/response regulator CckA